MNHDPLCRSREAPDDYWPEELCNCKFIAKVRANEQQQVASRLTGYHAKGCIGGSSGLGCGCGLWTDVVTYSVEQS